MAELCLVSLMQPYTISGATFKDEHGNDFMIASLPPEYVCSDAERRAWQDHFARQFEFPLVVAFWQSKADWIFRGQPRLLRLLEGRDIDKLPWQRILVHPRSRHPHHAAIHHNDRKGLTNR